MHPYVHSSTVYSSQDMEATYCPLTDKEVDTLIKKMWSTYTVEYYSVINKE